MATRVGVCDAVDQDMPCLPQIKVDRLARIAQPANEGFLGEPRCSHGLIVAMTRLLNGKHSLHIALQLGREWRTSISQERGGSLCKFQRLFVLVSIITQPRAL